MTPYDKIVEANLAHMQTPASQWRAVESSGETLVETDRGFKAMPVHEMPVGYTEAPSLYKHNGSSCCCNLCGKDIVNVYFIQNDERKWIMPVGSECVTHFELGLSGEELHKERQWQRNRELLASVIALRREIWTTFSKVTHQGYGRTSREMPRHGLGGQAEVIRKELIKITGQNDVEHSTNGALTTWARKHETRVGELLVAGRELLERHRLALEQQRPSRGLSL